MKRRYKITGLDRRNFINKASALSLGAFSISAGALKVFDQLVSSVEEPFSFRAKPLLTNVQETEIEIIASPNDLATGWVEYGSNQQELTQRSDAVSHGMYETSENVLHFILNNLDPGKEYFYRVHLQRIVYQANHRHEKTEEVQSEIYKFRTLNVNAISASFTCWNDTHENEETLGRLAKILHKQKPDFFVWNGDVTNDIFREEQIVEQFLNPISQGISTSIPLMYARGNHDVRGRGARSLPQYITGPDHRYYYAFRQGPLAAVVLDTGEDKPDNHYAYAGLLNFSDYRQKQANWLAEVIKQSWFSTAPFRIVFMHIPLVWEAEVPERWPNIWGEGIRGWICEDGYEKWHDLLVEGNIQLVISGHTHHPAYFPPNKDRPYGQLIGGGPKPESAVCITGLASENELNVKMELLDGGELESLTFDA